MARPINDQQVRDLIPNTELDNLIPFIVAANQLTTRMAATDCGSGLSDSELETVEAYLAAHFAAVTDPSLAIESEKVEGTSIKASRGNVASQGGILSTQFGQMANTLSSGCLAELDMRKPTLVFI